MFREGMWLWGPLLEPQRTHRILLLFPSLFFSFLPFTLQYFFPFLLLFHLSFHSFLIFTRFFFLSQISFTCWEQVFGESSFERRTKSAGQFFGGVQATGFDWFSLTPLPSFTILFSLSFYFLLFSPPSFPFLPSLFVSSPLMCITTLALLWVKFCMLSLLSFFFFPSHLSIRPEQHFSAHYFPLPLSFSLPVSLSLPSLLSKDQSYW